MTEAAVLTTEIAPAPTALALALAGSGLPLRMHAGALTPQAFSSPRQEITAALRNSAVADLGYRTRIRVTGPDRLRWLNGMVSNAIQTLPEHHGNYNFILNAQGRVQGDAYIYQAAESLFIDTDRSQATRLGAHLDHFIIMDDVELQALDEASTGIAVLGPQAAATLHSLGLEVNLAPLQFTRTTFAGKPITLIHAFSVDTPRFELWFDPEQGASLWERLTAAGAEPIGIDAVEALRIYQGIPSYGIDITDRSLPQETSQIRALNFTKGCYLGQEIVERIRSRATVHRGLRHFRLEGAPPAAPVDLRIAEDPAAIGQLTSIARIETEGFDQIFAIGSIRNEAVERKLPIVWDGGTATLLDRAEGRRF